MKKKKWYGLLGCVIFFMVLCLVSIIFLSYLLRPVSTSRKNICGFYGEEENALDVVYIGGSSCYRYWECLQVWNDYGFTSYNVATDALPPQVIEYLIREVGKTQNPQLFIVELRPFQYGALFNEEAQVLNMEHVAPYRNVSDSMNYSGNRTAMIHNTAPDGEPEWTMHFDLAKYHSLIGNIFLKNNWQYADNREYLYNKGFWANGDIGDFERTDWSGEQDEQVLADVLDQMLRSLLEYCDRQELQVLFVVPVYQLTQEDQKKYNYMEAVIREYGQDYLNVNDYFEEAGFDEATDFYNLNHTNLWGADKYTEFLAEYIHTKYPMADKRGDLKYQNWWDDYNKWNVEMDSIRRQLEDTVIEKR